MRGEVIETLRDGQRLGFFGSRPIEDAVEHALDFSRAIGPLSHARLIDLGSGGGLPGLVLAEVYPDCEIVLVDRRQRRTDFLVRAVSRLRLAHVDVRCADVADVAEDVAAGQELAFDVATARGFGPPEHTLRLATGLIRDGGMIVISEPPKGDRWSPELLAELGLTATRTTSMVRFDVSRETFR